MKFTEDYNELKKVLDDGWTVAHEQTENEWTTEEPKILKLTNNGGWTVAHTQAKEGWTTEDPQILKLINNNRWSVAHYQAKNGWITENLDILKLTTKNPNTTVLSLMLKYGCWIPPEHLKDVVIKGTTIWEQYLEHKD